MTTEPTYKNTVIKGVVYTALYLFTAWIMVSPFIINSAPVELNGTLAWIRLFIITCAAALLTKYFFYMVVTPWYSVQQEIMQNRFSERIEGYRPKVSVLIPAWNEEIGILQTVRSLLDSTYRNIEIVIVNDGSTDKSDALIKKFLRTYNASPHDIKILYKYKENGGKGNALNTAFGMSTGEIIVSIDADCCVDKYALENFITQFADPSVMAAVGNVRIGNTNALLGTIQYLEFLFSFYFKRADSVLNTIYIVGGAAGAFRREVFHRIGMYSTTNITEDIDMSVRVQKAGMRIAFAANAIVYTEGAGEMSSLLKQRLRWKRGRFETFTSHKSLFFSMEPHHNKMLSWFVLPLAVFGDFQLGFEIFFLLILYAFAYITNDFSLFFSAIIVVSFMFIIQMLYDDAYKARARFYILAPIGWLMFYVTTLVEVNALVTSLWGYMRKSEVKWQRWNRHGVDDQSIPLRP